MLHRFDRIRIPVYHIGGWHDDFVSVPPANFTAASAGAPAGFHRLLMGMWPHALNERPDYGGYDYYSIMHYSATAFTKNGLVTMESKPAGMCPGRRASPALHPFTSACIVGRCLPAVINSAVARSHDRSSRTRERFRRL